jgi:hypothetical protein
MYDTSVRIRNQAQTRIMRTDGFGVARKDVDRRLHVLSVEGPRDRERAHARTLRWLENGQLFAGTGDDYLTGTVHVRGRESHRFGSCDHRIGVTAENRAHAGLSCGGSVSHGPPAFADKHHGLFGGQNTRSNCRGNLANRMPRSSTDLTKRCCGVREQTEEGHKSDAHNQGLRNRRIGDGFRIGCGSVCDQIDTGNSGEPIQSISEVWNVKPRREESR